MLLLFTANMHITQFHSNSRSKLASQSEEVYVRPQQAGKQMHVAVKETLTQLQYMVMHSTILCFYSTNIFFPELFFLHVFNFLVGEILSFTLFTEEHHELRSATL